VQLSSGSIIYLPNNTVSGVLRILESGQGLSAKVTRFEAPRRVSVGGVSHWEESGEGAVPLPHFLISKMKMVCSDALWNTVLKLTCLQQKALHRTSMHCACRFFVKIGCAAQGGHRQMFPKYATEHSYMGNAGNFPKNFAKSANFRALGTNEQTKSR